MYKLFAVFYAFGYVTLFVFCYDRLHFGNKNESLGPFILYCARFALSLQKIGVGSAKHSSKFGVQFFPCTIIDFRFAMMRCHGVFHLLQPYPSLHERNSISWW